MSQNDQTVDDDNDEDRTQQFTLCHNEATQLHFEVIASKHKKRHINKDTIICPEWFMGNAYHNHTIESTSTSQIHQWEFKILSFNGGYMFFGIIQHNKITNEDQIPFKDLGGAYAKRQCGTLFSANSNQKGYKWYTDQKVPEIEENDVLVMEYSPAAKRLSFTTKKYKSKYKPSTTVNIPNVGAGKDIKYKMAVHLYSTKIIQMKYKIQDNLDNDEIKDDCSDDDDEDDDYNGLNFNAYGNKRRPNKSNESYWEKSEQQLKELAEELATKKSKAIEMGPRESKILLGIQIEEQSKKKALQAHNAKLQDHILKERQMTINKAFDLNGKLLSMHQDLLKNHKELDQQHKSLLQQQMLVAQEEAIATRWKERSKNWRTWDCGRVVSWIQYINKGKFQIYDADLPNAIHAQNVKGIDLPRQDFQAMKSWGITEFNDISYLLKAIVDLRENSDSQ